MRHRIFTMMSAWPRLNFVALKVIERGLDASGCECMDVYLTDNREIPCHLFVCQVPENEAGEYILIFSSWLREYATHRDGKVMTGVKATS